MSQTSSKLSLLITNSDCDATILIRDAIVLTYVTLWVKLIGHSWQEPNPISNFGRWIFLTHSWTKFEPLSIVRTWRSQVLILLMA